MSASAEAMPIIASAALSTAGAAVLIAALVLARRHWRDILGGIAFAALMWGWLTYGAAFLHLLEPDQAQQPQIARAR